MSAAQFYDQNGELRIDGTLVGGGGSPFNGGTITNELLIDTDGVHAFRIRDAAGVNSYLVVDTVNGGFSFVASPGSGHSALNVSTTAITLTDELGATMLDVEGGFASLGPGGEIAVTTGQVYLTLPTLPGPSGSLWNDNNTVKVVP